MTDQNGPSVLGAMSRYRAMCVVIAVAATSLSVLGAVLTAGDVDATASIGLRTPSTDNVLVLGQQGDASLGRYTAQRARFITSDEVLTVVGSVIGEDDIDELRSRVEVAPSGTANVLTVTASGTSSRAAIALAVAVVDAYGEQTALQVAERTTAAVDALQLRVDELAIEAGDSSSSSTDSAVADVQLEIAQFQATQAVFGNGIEFVVEPTSDSIESPGVPVRELALGLVLGLGLAATASWARADRNPQVTDPERAGVLLDRPLLAQISAAPVGRAGQTMTDPRALPTDDHRMVWSALEQTAQSGVIVVQSLGHVRSGLVAAQLAAAAAREDLAVLLVDADMNTGGLSAMIGCASSVGGLADTLRDDTDWQVNVVDLDTQDEYELAVLPAGRLGPVDVSAPRFAEESERWRAAYDYVFIDAEPITHAHVAVKAARAADGVLLVVGHGTEERELEEIRRIAAFHGIAILGFVYATADAGSHRTRSAGARRRSSASARSSRGEG